MKPPAFQPDITSWNLPLDSYIVTYTQEGYAQALLYAACMKQAGVVVPAIDPGDYLPPNKNRQGYKLFSVAIAQKWGYHNGPAKRLPTPPEHFSAAQQVSDQKCNGDAQQQVRDQQADFVQGLGISAYETARRQPDVLAAAQRWRTCMLPQGVGDLPETPADMPTGRLIEQFGLGAPANPDPDVIEPPTRAEPAEIRLATFDAQCRESSKYTATLYSDQVQAQLALIASNEDKLQDALAAERAESSKIADVLQQYGR